MGLEAVCYIAWNLSGRSLEGSLGLMQVIHHDRSLRELQVELVRVEKSLLMMICGQFAAVCCRLPTSMVGVGTAEGLCGAGRLQMLA